MTPALSDILFRPVRGLNLQPGTLADQLGSEPALLVFLRHFGCPFCRETVSDLRKLTAATPNFPPILFFAQGEISECEEFFAAYWPEARAVSDPKKELYSIMGLRRGSFGQIFGLRVWACTLRALSKGQFMGKPVGDPWLMPGAFLVKGAEILWSYPYKHQGDRPDWTMLPQCADAARALAASAGRSS